MDMNDYDSVAKIMSNADVMYAWEHGFCAEEIRQWIIKRMQRYDTLGYDYLLAIDKSSGNVIGQIGLLDEDIAGQHYVGIGYIIDKPYWGMGYATEGAKAMIDYAFNSLKVNQIVATIRPENTKSIAVAERLGMRLTATEVKHYNGKEMPHYVYELVNNIII